MWREGVGGEYGTSFVYSYENGKMRPAETVPGMGEGDKGEWRR
jgi:hypothetical protein